MNHTTGGTNQLDAMRHTEWQQYQNQPNRKVHGANMGPIWGRQDAGGSYVGTMNLAFLAGVDSLIPSNCIFHHRIPPVRTAPNDPFYMYLWCPPVH